jgi:hypothetical protein
MRVLVSARRGLHVAMSFAQRVEAVVGEGVDSGIRQAKIGDTSRDRGRIWGGIQLVSRMGVYGNDSSK